MFRKMKREKQAIGREECVAVLESEPRGVLSLLGDDGYPYGVPMNFLYCKETDRIYFHSGKAGHKIDAMKRCDKASFCVYDRGYRREGEWSLNVKSVIVFGRLRVVEDFDTAMDICRRLSYKYTSDGAYIEKEIAAFGKGTLTFELVPEYMTGKLVNES